MRSEGLLKDVVGGLLASHSALEQSHECAMVLDQGLKDGHRGFGRLRALACASHRSRYRGTRSPLQGVVT
jgi:hypothetical protein